MPHSRSRAPSAVPSTRREPVQTRSRERISAILDVTAMLVDSLGPEQVTTTLIAEHAEISVGSIYSYFRDRSAIFDEIVRRAIARQDELIAATRERRKGAPFLETTFEVVDAIANLYRTEPAFRTLWFSKWVSPEMLEAMRRSDEDNARQLISRMRNTHGLEFVSPDPMMTARLYVGLIDTGLGLAFRLNPDGETPMIEETKRAAATYLGAFLRPIGPTPRPRPRLRPASEPATGTIPPRLGAGRRSAPTPSATPAAPRTTRATKGRS